MSDTPAYVVANFTIYDPDEYRKYEKGFFPILKRYGGDFFTFDDSTIHFEGNQPVEGRMVLFKFPSEQDAKNWYADSDYQALSDHRRGGTKLKFLTMLHGLPARS